LAWATVAPGLASSPARTRGPPRNRASRERGKGQHHRSLGLCGVLLAAGGPDFPDGFPPS
jgi:hypothetical protein